MTAIVGLFPKDIPGPANPAMIDGVKIHIPLSRVVQQLPQGSAKISFGELRRASPPGAFRCSSDADGKLIDLPLSEILPQLNPTQFTRRSGQKRVEVPDDVTGIFSSDGGRLSAAGVTTSVTTMEKPVRTAPSPAAAPLTRSPAPFARTPPPPSPPAARAAAAEASAKPQTVIPFPGASSRVAPGTPVPPVAPARSAPVQPVKPAPAPQQPSLPKPSAAKPAPARSAAPAAFTGILPVALSEVSQSWPEPVRHEIEQLGLSASTLELPGGEVGESLKEGKVLYHWRRLRYWIKPTAPTDTSPHAETLLELPLNIVAPLYLSRCRTGHAQKKQHVDESIPDLFNQGTGNSDPQKAAASETAVLKRLPSSDDDLVTLSMAEASENWPAPIREEIVRYSLAESFLALPLEQVGVGLKQGRIVYHWRQLRYWIKPLPPTGLSPHGETLLELPLNILAPVYLQQRGRVSDNTAQLIRNNVPDLTDTAIHRFLEPVPPPPGSSNAPTRPAPRETVSPKLAKDLGELFGKPGKTRWTPHEIVECAARIPGVVGSLIALQDGLLVASQMPPQWKAENVAAFLPQIHGRIRQYTSELRLGELTNFSFAVEGGALQVFNAGVIYFAALCRTGESLPQHPLLLIVAELGRHTK